MGLVFFRLCLELPAADTRTSSMSRKTVRRFPNGIHEMIQGYFLALVWERRETRRHSAYLISRKSEADVELVRVRV